jgi:hypothetical protein
LVVSERHSSNTNRKLFREGIPLAAASTSSNHSPGVTAWFRRSHCGLCLRFGILFWFHSTTFGCVINISWCTIVKSRLELWESIRGCRS